MKVMFDARWIFNEISGIGLYSIELLKAISETDRDSRFILVFNDRNLMARTVDTIGVSAAPNFESILFPYGLFSLQSQIRMPSLIRKMAPDVYHSPNYMIPIMAFPGGRKHKTGCIITIHDIIPLLFPDHAPRSKKSRFMPVYRLLMRQVSARADGIITVSKNSADDISRILLPDPSSHDKVRSIYNGVSLAFRGIEHKPSTDPVKLLYVGRLDPYKNVTGLMMIFAQVRKQVSQKVKLVIAGPSDSRYPEARDLSRSLGLEADVEWTGYVTESQLLDLYRTSTALVHPSHYEGFGLPVIEAMAAGLPVVCSSAGSLAEIAGDAACVHDHYDEKGFVQSICSIIHSASMAKELSRKGREQAARFTWKTAAAETLQLYRQITGNRP